MHQFTHQELQRRGIADVALLPPPGPWTEGRVARLLKDRISFLDDEPVVTRIDVEQMNGYHIRAALLQSGRASWRAISPAPGFLETSQTA